jgi:hypothetical protein
MNIYWKPTADAFPMEGGWLKQDFTAFDEVAYIGRVYQVPHGSEKGLWIWSMTVVLPGPRFTHVTSGRESTRGDAGRRVVECYERMLKFYRRF